MYKGNNPENTKEQFIIRIYLGYARLFVMFAQVVSLGCTLKN